MLQDSISPGEVLRTKKSLSQSVNKDLKDAFPHVRLAAKLVQILTQFVKNICVSLLFGLFSHCTPLNKPKIFQILANKNAKLKMHA